MDDFFVSVTFIVLFYMIYKLFELFVCRKERMLLIEKIAEVAEDINATSEDIGARRLHTVMEYLLEDISFNAGGGDYPVIPVEINCKYVEEHLDKIIRNRDLKKYVL